MTYSLSIMAHHGTASKLSVSSTEMAQVCVLQMSPVGFRDSFTLGSEAWLPTLISMSRMEFPFCAVHQGGCQSASELQYKFQHRRQNHSLEGFLVLRRTLISLAVLEPWPQLAWEAGECPFFKGWPSTCLKSECCCWVLGGGEIRMLPWTQPLSSKDSHLASVSP